jgi:hypothetical protein
MSQRFTGRWLIVDATAPGTPVTEMNRPNIDRQRPLVLGRKAPPAVQVHRVADRESAEVHVDDRGVDHS